MSYDNSNPVPQGNVTVSQVGGVQRVTVRSARDSEMTSDRSAEALAKVDATQHTAFRKEQMRVNFSEMPNGLDGVLSTARTPWGTPTHEVDSKSVIEVEGISMQVREAERLGLVRKDASGQYRSLYAPAQVPQGPRRRTDMDDPMRNLFREEYERAPEGTPSVPEEAPLSDGDRALIEEAGPKPFVDAADERALREIATAVTPEALGRGLEMYTRAIGEGREEIDLAALSQVTNLPPEQTEKLWTAVRDAYAKQAAAFMADKDIDYLDFVRVMRQTDPKALASMWATHVRTQNPSVYARYIGKYKADRGALANPDPAVTQVKQAMQARGHGMTKADAKADDFDWDAYDRTSQLRGHRR